MNHDEIVSTYRTKLSEVEGRVHRLEIAMAQSQRHIRDEKEKNSRLTSQLVYAESCLAGL